MQRTDHSQIYAKSQDPELKENTLSFVLNANDASFVNEISLQ